MPVCPDSLAGVVQVAGACVCSQETFTVREDRPVVREVTDYILEHHLFEREYVRQVRYRGEQEVVNTSAAVERALSNPLSALPLILDLSLLGFLCNESACCWYARTFVKSRPVCKVGTKPVSGVFGLVRLARACLDRWRRPAVMLVMILSVPA